jgi:hypothetical protein
MHVCREFRDLSGRGLCFGLIIPPEESYRLWCDWVWLWNLDSEEALADLGAVCAIAKRLKTGTHTSYLKSELLRIVECSDGGYITLISTSIMYSCSFASSLYLLCSILNYLFIFHSLIPCSCQVHQTSVINNLIFPSVQFTGRPISFIVSIWITKLASGSATRGAERKVPFWIPHI